MSGVADIRALHRQRHAARADADPLRAGPGRIDRAQHASPSSTGRSPTAGCRRCASRSPAGSAAAAASPSAPRARWSASIICRRASLQLGPTRLPVCPIGPAIVVQAAGRAGARQRALQRAGARTDASAARRCISPRPAARSSASNSPSTALGDAARQAGLADRVRCRAARPAASSAPASAASSAARKRDDRQRPAAAERRVGQAGWSITATSASTAR